MTKKHSQQRVWEDLQEQLRRQHAEELGEVAAGGGKAEMTEAQTDYIAALGEAAEIIRAAGADLDAREGLAPCGESAVSAALAALDAAITAEREAS
jgi:hypothetical protein